MSSDINNQISFSPERVPSTEDSSIIPATNEERVYHPEDGAQFIQSKKLFQIIDVEI